MPAPIGTRRLARYRDVGPAEVALVGEAGVECDVGESAPRLHHKLLRHRDAFADHVLVRRVASALLERAVEVSERESRAPSESIGGDALGQVLLDVLANASQRAGAEPTARPVQNRPRTPLCAGGHHGRLYLSV